MIHEVDGGVVWLESLLKENVTIFKKHQIDLMLDTVRLFAETLVTRTK